MKNKLYVAFHLIPIPPTTVFLEHIQYWDSEERIVLTMKALREAKAKGKISFIEQDLTQETDLENVKKWLMQMHNPDMVNWIEKIYDIANTAVLPLYHPYSKYCTRIPSTGPKALVAQAGYWCFDRTTPIHSSTFLAACMSVKCALSCAEFVLHSDIQPAYAISLCRPMGHHANDTKYGGYCYFNNAAAAVKALQRGCKCNGDSKKGDCVISKTFKFTSTITAAHIKNGCEKEAPCRVAVLDLDRHHGNGTQDLFYEDPTVLFCSIHEDPDTGGELYFSGYDTELGHGKGLGTNFNFPLRAPIDEERYAPAFHDMLQKVIEFDPRYLVISFGADIHKDDPTMNDFGGVNIEMMEYMGTEIHKLGLPAVVVLEGGYNMEVIGSCILAFVTGLTQPNKKKPEIFQRDWI